MSKAVKAARYLLLNDSTIGALVGSRCFPFDSIPSNCRRPFLALTRESDTGEADLNGRVEERIAAIKLEIVTDTYAAATAIMAAVPVAIAGGGRTVDGVVLFQSQAEDGGDAPDGPVDLPGGEAFIATVALNFAYQP